MDSICACSMPMKRAVLSAVDSDVGPDSRNEPFARSDAVDRFEHLAVQEAVFALKLFTQVLVQWVDVGFSHLGRGLKRCFFRSLGGCLGRIGRSHGSNSFIVRSLVRTVRCS